MSMGPAFGLLRPEAQLLVLGRGPDAPDAEVAAVVARGVDWAVLAGLAEREKAARAVFRRLAALPPGVVPRDALGPLQRLSMVSEFRMLGFEASLGRALTTLEAAGVEAVLLKGAALAATTYGSLVERPVSDLDLLVKPADASIAWDALTGAGWRVIPGQAPMDGFYTHHHHLRQLVAPGGGGLKLELHRHLFPDGSGFNLDLDDLWGTVRVRSFRERPVLVPAPEYLVLHVCLHFAWSDMLQRGAWKAMRDLAALLGSGSVDDDRVRTLAITTRGRSCSYWALRLAHNVAGVSVAAPLLEALRPPGPGRLLDALERHYAASAFLDGSRCPSARLAELLWELGIRPGWSGHGRSRPWDSTRRLRTVLGAEPKHEGVLHRLATMPMKVRSASAYMASLLRGG